MVSILPNINNNSNKPIYVQLYEFIRDEIISGQISADEKLPSIRQLSKDLYLSRTTIENAYNQLNMEGYIYSVPNKGFFASTLEASLIGNVDNNEGNVDRDKYQQLSTEYENLVDKESFNFALWKRYISKVFLEYEERLLMQNNNQGEYELRGEIAKYVHRARGVRCTPDNIIIGAGIQTLIGILGVLFRNLNYSKIAFEEPGFIEPHQIFKSQSYDIVPIQVDSEGLNIKKLRDTDTQLCFVSPSHQFPMGSIMPIAKRMELLRWANDVDGLIIEDDYDSELRYSGRPIPCLQGLDKKERVVYLGSFSTLLIPAIRISYMILPDRLLKRYKEVQTMYKQTSSKIDQLTLALYMQDGEFDRHIRRLKKLYAKKNQLLINAIKKELGDTIDVLGTESGLYMLLQFKNNGGKLYDFTSIKGIRLRPLSQYVMSKDVCVYNDKYILSYRGIPIEKIDETIKQVKKIIHR